MKLKEINNNGLRLKVTIKKDHFAWVLYQSFKSVKELSDYMENNYNISRSQYSYFY